MNRYSPRHWMALGLLILSGGVALRAIGPVGLHSDLGDLLVGLMAGVGLGIEIMALVKMRRAR